MRLGARLTDDLALRAVIRGLAARLAGQVTDVSLDRSVLQTAERGMTRLNSGYAPALRLIRMLLESESITLDATGRDVVLPGFLFDMNRLFQAVLSRFLRENLTGYALRDEHQLKGVMVYLPDYNPRGRLDPVPRPDYVLSKDGRVVAVLDAKYIDLWDHAPGRDVLYQLAIYALGTSHVDSATILYPSTASSAREARIEIRDPFTASHRAIIKLRPVDLQRLEMLIRDPYNSRLAHARASFARSLAFGSAAAG